MAQTNSSGNETSIKQLFQSMIPAGDELMEGTVIQTEPLKIQMTGDDKLIISDRITIVPWHLTDYTTKATYSLCDGEIDAITEGDGRHDHGSSGEHTHSDSSHSHSGGAHLHVQEGVHTHHLITYSLSKGTITVHNALKQGDKVHILALNHGKLYYVLDRVAGQEVV